MSGFVHIDLAIDNHSDEGLGETVAAVAQAATGRAPHPDDAATALTEALAGVLALRDSRRTLTTGNHGGLDTLHLAIAGANPVETTRARDMFARLADAGANGIVEWAYLDETGPQLHRWRLDFGMLHVEVGDSIVYREVA